MILCFRCNLRESLDLTRGCDDEKYLPIFWGISIPLQRNQFNLLSLARSLQFFFSAPWFLSCYTFDLLALWMSKHLVDVMIRFHRKSISDDQKLQTTIIWSTTEYLLNGLFFSLWILGIFFFSVVRSVHNKPMLWTRVGRKHGNVHGDWLNFWSACLLDVMPSGFELAGLDLTHITQNIARRFVLPQNRSM